MIRRLKMESTEDQSTVRLVRSVKLGFEFKLESS